MTVFILIGGLGLAAVLVSLFLSDLLEDRFSALDKYVGGTRAAPVFGSFLAAFGFGAALIYGNDVGVGIAAFGGLVSGACVGGIAWAVARSLMNTPAAAPVFRGQGMVGHGATVVASIPTEGYGEVSLVYEGHLMKMAARAAQPVAAGVPVRISKVLSPSSVMVEPAVNPESAN